MIRKRFYVIMLVINIFIAYAYTAGYTQSADTEKKYNTQYNTISLIKRLSYENFKNIKLLRSAIMNYGGGEAEFQKLIDQYAEATALYFEDKTDEAASRFSENEREILKIAKKIAAEYQKDSSQFLNKAIKRNIQIAIQREVDGKERNEVMNKYLDNAKSALKKASSILDDYKYSNEKTSGSAQRLVTSIYYYRAAKQNLFLMYQAHVDTLVLDPKDSKKDKEKKEELMDKMIREDYKSEYKKDIQDNKNQVYTSMEKKI